MENSLLISFFASSWLNITTIGTLLKVLFHGIMRDRFSIVQCLKEYSELNLFKCLVPSQTLKMHFKQIVQFYPGLLFSCLKPFPSSRASNLPLLKIGNTRLSLNKHKSKLRLLSHIQIIRFCDVIVNELERATAQWLSA